MKEEFITFETAKLAKEKGFNISVLEYICIHGVFQCINESTYYEEGDGYRCLNNLGGPILQDYNNVKIDSDYAGQGPCFYNDEDRSIYSAPTQSLLQRWLRERHNIHMECVHTTLNTLNNISYYCNIYDYKNHHYSAQLNPLETKFHNTYEQALEEALYKALKQIKKLN